MAYGIVLYNEAGEEWLNSETAFGFIEVSNFSVSTDGSTGNSASGTLDSGYTAIYPVYVPASIDDDETDSDSRQPSLASSFNSGTGAWSVTQTWTGSAGSDVRVKGGRVLVFAH